jgi:hypothetical protein
MACTTQGDRMIAQKKITSSHIVVHACSPAAMSEADQLGLSLLADSLALPDSWDVCLALKALALNNCWNLAHTDQVSSSADLWIVGLLLHTA